MLPVVFVLERQALPVGVGFRRKKFAIPAGQEKGSGSYGRGSGLVVKVMV